MKIIAGLSPDYIVRNQKLGDDYSKIEKLIESGINEFFIGYVPNYWFENFGFEISPNGRQSAQAQIQSKEHLKGIVKFIQSKNCEVFVTLNANSFNDSIWEKIKKIINDIEEVGVDGIIISDLGVLNYLNEIKYKGKINVSTIFNIYNSEIIKFLDKNYNINRMILPREMTLREIGKICEEFPKIEFEAFLNGDKCIWNNGSCFTEHNTKGNPHSYCQYIEKIYQPKKRIPYNFKDIINSGDYKEIHEKMNNTAIGTLDEVGNKLLTEEVSKEYFIKQYNIFKNKLITKYDNSISQHREYNKNIIKFFKGMQFQIEIENILEEKFSINSLENKEIINFMNQGLDDIEKGIKFYNNKIESEGAEYIKKVDTLEWNRNGVAFMEYFKQFPNLVALKVPSRGKEIHHIVEYMLSKDDLILDKYKDNNLLSEDKDNSSKKFYYYNPIDNKLI